MGGSNFQVSGKSAQVKLKVAGAELSSPFIAERPKKTFLWLLLDIGNSRLLGAW